MEIVNMMFEKYGGRQVARIFRTYLILSLVLKELMFSLFLIPEDRSAIDPAPDFNTAVFGEKNTAETDTGSLKILHLLLPLTRNAAGKLSGSQDFPSTTPLPQYECI